MRLTINWHHGFSNLPEFELHLSKPVTHNFRYLWYPESHYYYAEDGIFTAFYAYNGPGDGFGGATIPVKLVNGEIHELKGPYAGNVGYVNSQRLWQEYPGARQPVVSIVSVAGGHSRISANCIFSAVRDLRPNGVHIVCTDGQRVYRHWRDVPPNHSFMYVPSTSATELTKPDV